MIQFGILCILVAGIAADAGYSSSGVGAGAASGTFNGGTYGSNFPYNGFQGKNAGAGSGFGFAPQVPFFQPVPFPTNYNDFVANFFKNFQNQQFGGSSLTFANPGATAYAASYLGPQNLYNNQLPHQSAFYNPALANAIPQQQGSYAPNYNGNSNGFGFAGASGSFGPGGYHQTASIYPANPNSPNVDTRFGGDEKVTHDQGPAGVSGISTSSFSSSSDVDGVKNTHREAVTSVNDNGKVTTYHVRS